MGSPRRQGGADHRRGRRAWAKPTPNCLRARAQPSWSMTSAVPATVPASDLSMAQKVVEAIKAEGGRAVANGADISTMAGGQSVFDDAIKHFGRADILVNNAGILLDQTFAKATEAAWDKVLKVHLKGTFCTTQPVFRWMRENGGGVIVNTSSTSGLIGNFGQYNYGAAKGGIWGLSNVLAIEGRKYNIRVWTLGAGRADAHDRGFATLQRKSRHGRWDRTALRRPCYTWSAISRATRPARCSASPARVACAKCG